MAWSGGTFTRTNGVNTGATAWVTDAASAVKIRADRHDTHDQDLATGINQCINKDGSNTATQLNVDNLRADGNTISSTNTNGNIELSPNGTGLVNIAAAGDLAIAGTAITGTAAELNLASIGNISGSYTGQSTGLAALPNETIYYRIVGKVAHLEMRGSLSGTSDATSFTITGGPSAIRPASASAQTMVKITNNGTLEVGSVSMGTDGIITITRSTSATWTASGTKAIATFSMSYMLTLP